MAMTGRRDADSFREKYGITEKEYYRILGETRTSRLNDIIYAVSCRVPKEEAGLANTFESVFYDELTAEAQEHEKKYGCWPVFEIGEIEWDDPRLDIYREPVG